MIHQNNLYPTQVNINDTLLSTIEPHLDNYGVKWFELHDFLNTTEHFLKRRQKAFVLIENIMTAHGKEPLLKSISELARIEYGIRKLKQKHRDHVAHAILSFTLGIYINEKFLYTKGIHASPFQWKLASIFHDIGYPAEIENSLLREFDEKINEIRRLFGANDQNRYFITIPKGLENLTNKKNSLELIQKCLKKWGLRINAKKEYRGMVESGNINHGIISSLVILNAIDIMYQKNNLAQYHFENDVIPACSAIYIHNLQPECFATAKIDRKKAPLAFLLKLSDCLQEWERPFFENLNGIPSTKFSIEIDIENQLILHAKISTAKKKKIKEEIFSSLVCPDVQIL